MHCSFDELVFSPQKWDLRRPIYPLPDAQKTCHFSKQSKKRSKPQMLTSQHQSCWQYAVTCGQHTIFIQMTICALTGHSSAASLPTGPVIAEPFISPLGLTICIHTRQPHCPFPSPITPSSHLTHPPSSSHSTSSPSPHHTQKEKQSHSPHQHYPQSTGTRRPRAATACSA